MADNRLEPLEDLVGDLFVDRQAELDLFWDWAMRIRNPANSSIALIGRRRTGKTAILVKLFNRLFYEQDTVMPVYISFAGYLPRREPVNSFEFARDYFTGYLGSYLAFQHREPILLREQFDLDRLRHFARQVQDEYALELCERYDGSRADTEYTTHGLVQWVINFPRGTAAVRNIPTAMIVDEFQVLTNVHFPVQDVHHDVTDSFQWAADTKWAPLLVSGSAVSLLVNQALGGMLSGRFQYWFLEPLRREYTHDLVFRLGRATGAETSEELAEAIWQLTAGYPYSIYCLMASVAPARGRYPALDALEEVTTFELINPLGKLRQHYSEEFDKYSEQLNEGQVTRRVMLWVTKHPGQRVFAEQAAQELGVDEGEARDALERLRWVDVVQKIGLISYQGPTDPMLHRYIEYQHYTEIDKLSPPEAMKDWEKEYQRLRGQVSNFIGEVAEVYVDAVMRAFDGHEGDGATYFNHSGPVQLPVFEKIERRGGVVKAGVPVEIDLTGEWELPDGAGTAAWLVQVEYPQAPVGEEDVRRFLAQTDTVLAERQYTTVTLWYFCRQGYTGSAAEVLEQAGVLFSDREQFNALANLFGFFGLPK